MITLARQMMRSGLGSMQEVTRWIESGDVQLNQAAAAPDQPIHSGDKIHLRGLDFLVDTSGERLIIETIALPVADRITRPCRVHCGYHKGLTMYVRNVMDNLCHSAPGFCGEFRHFFHRDDLFYAECQRYAICSLSGHAVQLDRFADIKVSRFVRDPRDLLVSGYFYHLRGAEHWSCFKDVRDQEWQVIGATVPKQITSGQSFCGWLQTVSVEQGLLAEIEFRRQHFASILQWPDQDDRVRLWRYEDIIGNERRTFSELLKFYDLPWRTRRWGARHAERMSASKRGDNKHIRNPVQGQWRDHFTPTVERAFNDAYGEVLEKLGYH